MSSANVDALKNVAIQLRTQEIQNEGNLPGFLTEKNSRGGKTIEHCFSKQ